MRGSCYSVGVRLIFRITALCLAGSYVAPYIDFDPELAAWIAGTVAVVLGAVVELRRTSPVTREDLLVLQIELAELRGTVNVLLGRPADELELELDSE